MPDEEAENLRDRLSRQGEEALGKLASDLLENPLINSAITRAFSAREKAAQWVMDNPVRTFDWKAQFDDAKLRGPYENLSKHEACEFASYLLRRFPDLRLRRRRGCCSP